VVPFGISCGIQLPTGERALAETQLHEYLSGNILSLV
jgi:hypothetical protein